MIVVNEKPNITHLPYEKGKANGVFSFVPGQNRIDPDVWAAVKKTAGKDMNLHYGKFLKPIGEDTPDEDAPNPGQLSADEAITLIGGAMTLELLTAYARIRERPQRGCTENRNGSHRAPGGPDTGHRGQ